MLTLAAVLWTTLTVGTNPPPPQLDALTRARQAYNTQQYDVAITAAAEARKVPALADAASVVLARALLERYRQRMGSDDLTAAREALKQTDVARLSPRDQVDHTIALGESLYFGEHYSAAAETFEIALAAGGVEGDARERLFEWWASSLDQQAQFSPEADRRPIYARLLDRATSELAARNSSAVATYWLAAAARGTDDIARAWGAAVSGWIRAMGMPGHGAALRADLDRLVIQAILPERARRIAPADPRTALPALIEEWNKIKRDWD